MTFNGEKVLPVQEIAEALDIPDYTVKSFINMLKNREIESKNYFVETTENGKREVYISAAGTLYLYHKLGDPKDCVKFLPLLGKYFEDNSNEMLSDLKALVNKYTTVQETPAVTGKRSLVKDYGRGTYNSYEQDAKLLPEANDAAKTWCGRMNAIMKKNKDLLNKAYGSPSLTMKHIYTKMRNVYGIVFEQEKKDFLKAYHLDDKLTVSKMRLVQEKEKLMSIYQSILETEISNLQENGINTNT